MKWYGYIIVIALTVCLWVYLLNDINPPLIPKSAPEFDIRNVAKYPKAYMTIVDIGNPGYDSAILATSERNWCTQGHHGQQVLIVTTEGFKFMTFEELKSIPK